MFPLFWAIIVLAAALCFFVLMYVDKYGPKPSAPLVLSLFLNFYLIPVAIRLAYLLYAPEAGG